jgi:hypothetical protein
MQATRPIANDETIVFLTMLSDSISIFLEELSRGN